MDLWVEQMKPKYLIDDDFLILSLRFWIPGFGSASLKIATNFEKDFVGKWAMKQKFIFGLTIGVPMIIWLPC